MGESTTGDADETTSERTFPALATQVLLLCAVAACSMPPKRPTDPKTPTEQLLVSLAIERSVADWTLGIPEGTPVTLDTSGLTADQHFMGDVVAGWLGKQGLRVQRDDKNAKYRVRLIIQSLGTRQSVRLFGMPPSQSQWLPISLPEIALWKRDRQEGVARFYVDLFDARSHRWVRSNEPHEGSVYQTRYTALMVIRWRRTNIGDDD